MRGRLRKLFQHSENGDATTRNVHIRAARNLEKKEKRIVVVIIARICPELKRAQIVRM